MRLAREVGTIKKLFNTWALVVSQADITLQISIRLPYGVPDDIVRTVIENCRTLKLGCFEFEEE